MREAAYHHAMAAIHRVHADRCRELESLYLALGQDGDAEHQADLGREYVAMAEQRDGLAGAAESGEEDEGSELDEVDGWPDLPRGW